MHTWPRSRFTRPRLAIPCGCLQLGTARPAAPNGAAPARKGATPQAEGLPRARGQACFHTLAPRPPGVAPVPMIPGGKATGQAR